MADDDTTTVDDTTTTDDTTNDDTTVDDTTTTDKTDWKALSRKHERRSKDNDRRAREAEAKLAELQTASQSDQEKALEQARKEARDEARTEGQNERRADRLEVAVTRLAAHTFADTEDALIHIQRAIASGDLDADDIFNSEGKVQTDALEAALEALLERKQHLAATANNAGRRATGDPDAGKGAGGTGEASFNDVMRARARK